MNLYRRLDQRDQHTSDWSKPYVDSPLPVAPKLLYVATGALGGLVWFMRSYLTNLYQNNQYIAKLLCEVAGATITTFIVLTGAGRIFQEFSNDATFLVCFGIGIAWGKIADMIRDDTSRKVRQLPYPSDDQSGPTQ